MKVKISILVAILAVATTSCLENKIVYDTENLNYRPIKIDIPLAKVKVPFTEESIKKYLDMEDQEYELVVENGVFCFKYIHKQEIEWFNEIKIDDGAHNFRYDFKVGNWKDAPFLQFGELTITDEKEYFFKMHTSDDSNSYVTEMELVGGLLSISFVPPAFSLKSYAIEIKIPQLTKNNVPFACTLTNQQPSLRNQSMSGYIVKADANNGKEIKIICNFTATAATSAITDGSFGIHLEYEEMKFDFLAGYFGEITQRRKDNMEFNFFKDLEISGTFGLRGVTMTTEVINHVGAPMNVEADIYFTNEKGSKVPVELKNPYEFVIPSAVKDNKNNITPAELKPPFVSELEDILFDNPSEYPTILTFDFTGIMNRGKGPGSIDNFIKKSSEQLADIQMTLTVPLDVALMYSRSDSIDFDYRDLCFDDEKFSKSIKTFILDFEIENFLPFDVVLKVYAINETGTRKVDIQTIDIKAIKTIQNKSLSLKPSQLNDLWNFEVKEMILETTIKSKDVDYQKITPKDFVNINISASYEGGFPPIL